MDLTRNPALDPVPNGLRVELEDRRDVAYGQEVVHGYDATRPTCRTRVLLRARYRPQGVLHRTLHAVLQLTANA